MVRKPDFHGPDPLIFAWIFSGTAPGAHFFSFFPELYQKSVILAPLLDPAGAQIATKIRPNPGKTVRRELDAPYFSRSWRRLVPQSPPEEAQRPPKAPQARFLTSFGRMVKTHEKS